MDLNFSPEEGQFRRTLRQWLEENVPLSGLRGADPNATRDKSAIEKSKAWQRRLYDAGYVALAWPREYGGQELDPVCGSIVNEEMVRARAPALLARWEFRCSAPR
jgi:alkylation response protein AidB-like acyl-CoA dehydrogenase